MAGATKIITTIVEFELAGGRRFLVNVDEESEGAVRIDRQWPDPDRGRRVAGATGLDLAPTWRLPQSWTPRECNYVRLTVTDAWARHRQGQHEGRSDGG